MLVCANVGDSRAVIGERIKLSEGEGKESYSWMPRAISNDHKPNLEVEHDRIIKCGGRVETYLDDDRMPIGPYRVWKKDEDVPGLAMSRSMGDKVAAEVGVICTPEIIETKLTERDKIVILASDGVWEHLGSQKVVQIVGECWGRTDASRAASVLAQAAVKAWKEAAEFVVDDITAIVVFLK